MKYQKALAAVALVFLSMSVNAAVVVLMGQSNAARLYESGAVQRLFKNDQVVNCGHRGQKVETFLPSEDKGSYYRSCVDAVAGRRVRAVVWWQGESDSQLAQDADAWKPRFKRVMSSFLKEVGTRGTKLVVMTLKQSDPKLLAHFPQWDSVRMQQKSVPGIKIDTSGYSYRYDEGGINLEGVSLHCDGGGYRRAAAGIAKRIVNAERNI